MSQGTVETRWWLQLHGLLSSVPLNGPLDGTEPQPSLVCKTESTTRTLGENRNSTELWPLWVPNLSDPFSVLILLRADTS